MLRCGVSFLWKKIGRLRVKLSQFLSWVNILLLSNWKCSIRFYEPYGWRGNLAPVDCGGFTNEKWTIISQPNLKTCKYMTAFQFCIENLNQKIHMHIYYRGKLERLDFRCLSNTKQLFHQYCQLVQKVFSCSIQN